MRENEPLQTPYHGKHAARSAHRRCRCCVLGAAGSSALLQLGGSVLVLLGAANHRHTPLPLQLCSAAIVSIANFSMLSVMGSRTAYRSKHGARSDHCGSYEHCKHLTHYLAGISASRKIQHSACPVHVDHFASTYKGASDSKCEICNIGEYQVQRGKESCDKCPENYYCPNDERTCEVDSWHQESRVAEEAVDDDNMEKFAIETELIYKSRRAELQWKRWMMTASSHTALSADSSTQDTTAAVMVS
ncbi:hypothetical protein UY3_03390 [Chelonia mydas]|uniref:Tyrosine-protein kinase ephrin type A/B receptor-like domain-containing protein n=1 Tax=Chelonia mydas TaxID=8469 RepID=M7C4L8_CHEMY|nr:hypothetical protein UY3_03390 [Chelonia mydas]